MNKEEVIKLMIDHQEGIVKDLQEAVDLRQEAKDLDESDTIDPEDLSHQTENSEMEYRFQAQLDKAEKYLDFVQGLDGESDDKIQIGSLVVTDQMSFLIGIPSIALEHGSKIIMGISAKAPIYQSMINKTKGETFKYGNKKYKIENIL